MLYNTKKRQKQAIAARYGLWEETYVDPQKTAEYEKYLNSPQAKLERFLDALSQERRFRQGF